MQSFLVWPSRLQTWSSVFPCSTVSEACWLLVVETRRTWIARHRSVHAREWSWGQASCLPFCQLSSYTLLFLLFLTTPMSVGGYTFSSCIFNWYNNWAASPLSPFMILSIFLVSYLTLSAVKVGCNLLKFSIFEGTSSLIVTHYNYFLENSLKLAC